jgi:hypothetical protein
MPCLSELTEGKAPVAECPGSARPLAGFQGTLTGGQISPQFGKPIETSVDGLTYLFIHVVAVG